MTFRGGCLRSRAASCRSSWHQSNQSKACRKGSWRTPAAGAGGRWLWVTTPLVPWPPRSRRVPGGCHRPGAGPSTPGIPIPHPAPAGAGPGLRLASPIPLPRILMTFPGIFNIYFFLFFLFIIFFQSGISSLPPLPASSACTEPSCIPGAGGRGLMRWHRPVPPPFFFPPSPCIYKKK